MSRETQVFSCGYYCPKIQSSWFYHLGRFRDREPSSGMLTSKWDLAVHILCLPPVDIELPTDLFTQPQGKLTPVTISININGKVGIPRNIRSHIWRKEKIKININLNRDNLGNRNNNLKDIQESILFLKHSHALMKKNNQRTRKHLELGIIIA